MYEKEVRKLEDLGETLIEDPGIHSNDKGLVTSEKQSIREHWESLNTKAHNVQRKYVNNCSIKTNKLKTFAGTFAINGQLKSLYKHLVTSQQLTREVVPEAFACLDLPSPHPVW